MKSSEIKELLDRRPDLRTKLFERGFLATNDPRIDPDGYPFYGSWNKTVINDITFLVSANQKLHYSSDGSISVAMVGHAYDPFGGEYEEDVILSGLLSAYGAGWDRFYNAFNNLTGVYTLFLTDGDKTYVLGDTVGLQSVFYTVSNGAFYISSHTNLIGDLLSLEKDEYIVKLTAYKYFNLFGNQLPGDLTQFKSVKRLVPNHSAVFSNRSVKCERFYYPHYLDVDENELITRVSDVLRSTMALIAKKWRSPAISLTGGCDSKTTLAGASDDYGRFSYFSYISQPNEKPDAVAAKRICDKLGLKHTLYEIPENDGEITDVEETRKLLLWNCGDICPNHPYEVRKRAVLSKVVDFDIEVKSWVSEVGRARYTKRYNGRVDFGKQPTPRKCTTFYKFFLMNRGLVRKTDKVFKEYLDKFFASANDHPIPWEDQFYWEWHWPSRDGIILTCEHRFAFDITVPYNNRKLLELLLSAPQVDRINDEVYKRVRAKLDPEIDKACDAVVDVNHSNKRALAESLYYSVNSHIPF